MLLYAVERPQYKQVNRAHYLSMAIEITMNVFRVQVQETHGIGDKVQPSNVYGIVHLLRLMSMSMTIGFIRCEMRLCS